MTRATKAILLLWLSAFLVASLGACRPGSSSKPPKPEEPGVAPSRIVVMAPGAAEMLQSLGLLGKVVGVGDFVTWPAELQKLPKLGAYDAPNEELVLGLRADILITSLGKEGSSRLHHLESLGVPVLRLDLSTYDGVFTSLRELGVRFRCEERARGLEKAMRERLERVRRAAAGAKRRKVLFLVGRDPLYVAGAGSHIDTLLRLAGGENIAADSRTPYELTSMEIVLKRQPEVILDSSENRVTTFGRRTAGWEKWPFLPAVRTGEIYVLDPWRSSIPGPRLPEMAELLGKLIHPEIFGPPQAGELGPPSPPSP